MMGLCLPQPASCIYQVQAVPPPALEPQCALAKAAANMMILALFVTTGRHVVLCLLHARWIAALWSCRNTGKFSDSLDVD